MHYAQSTVYARVAMNRIVDLLKDDDGQLHVSSLDIQNDSTYTNEIEGRTETQNDMKANVVKHNTNDRYNML